MSSSTLPTASNMKKRKSDMTLDKILKTQEEQIRAEVNLFEQVKQYFTTANSVSGSVVMAHCANHIKAMDQVLNDIKGKVVISFFAKPGYGKSFMINNLISGFECRYDSPLPSGRSIGKGLTATVIDVMYGEHYKLTKVMCTLDEYLVRAKLHNRSNEKIYESKDYDFKQVTETIDNDVRLDNAADLDNICKRALEKISHFEKVKSEFECLTVKKLILYLPSQFLLENKIIVRDMPGYDEHSKSDLYKQYIRESMEDTCILISGVENSRSMFDSGIVKKYWEYGIYSPKQLFPPSIMIGINDKEQGDPKGYELLDLTNDYDTLKSSFRDQVANFFDVEIEGAKKLANCSSVETNIIENKIEFVTDLSNNISVIAFPPKEHQSELFKRQFFAQVEQTRMKIIENNCDRLRDIAIIILSNIHCKTTKEKDSSSDLKKRLTTLKNSILDKLRAKIEHTKTVSPTFEDLMEGNESYSAIQFITNLYNFFKRGIDECFNMTDFEEMLEKGKKSRFKKEDKKKEWGEIYEDFHKNFLDIIETMKGNANELASELHSFLISKLSAIVTELEEEFITNLVTTLNPESEEETDNSLILEINNYICDYSEKLSDFLKDTEKIQSLNSSEKDKIRDLLESYKKKKPQSKTLEISLRSKLQNPQLAPTSGLKKPTEESKNVLELRTKEYVASIDPAIRKFSFSKLDKSKLILEKADMVDSNSNEAIISFDWSSKKLSIAYTEHMSQACAEFKSIKRNGKDAEFSESEMKELKLAPIFLITRPRGNWSEWKPNLMIDSLSHLSKQQYLFFIVTERCYVERYKKLLKESNVESNYKFLILDENIKLGFARAETLVFLTCEHFQMETAIVMHDDIRLFYEYLHDQKITTHHNYAMIRSCLQLEDTLYEQLFAPKEVNEIVEKLRTLLTAESLAYSHTALTKKISRNDKLSEEEQDKLIENINNYIAGIKNADSRELALVKVAENPNNFIEYARIAELKIVDDVVKLFDRAKHVGRVSLYDYQTCPTTRNKLLGLNRPTHVLSNSKSAVHIYYIKSMKGIHSISDEEFWKKPDDSERKKLLKKILKAKKKKEYLLKQMKLVAEKGYRYADPFLKTQMLLHGVGSYQLFSFAFSSNPNAPSLNDFGDTKRGANFDSDDEQEIELENVTSISDNKKRKRKLKDSTSKKSKK